MVKIRISKSNNYFNRHTTYAPTFNKNIKLEVLDVKEEQKVKIEFVDKTEELHNELEIKSNLKRMALDFNK